MRHVSVVICVLCAQAFAQAPDAEVLFQQGRTLIKQGKLEAGCDKLAASEKVESRAGTLLNLGDCREKLGKTAAAWQAFHKAEGAAKRVGDKKREREARRRAERLESDLASVTLQVGPKAKQSGLVIKRDGEVIAAELWGDAIVIEPGSHTIVAEAPGKKPWKQEFSVGKGGKRWIVVPTLEPVETATPAVVPPPPPPPVTVAEPPPPVQTKTVVITPTWSATRGVAVAVTILGAGAIGVGAYFGTRATDLERQSDALCPMVECSNPEGLTLNASAQQNARTANVLFFAGGTALVAGAVMWVVGKPQTETAIVPVVSETGAGATLTRRF